MWTHEGRLEKLELKPHVLKEKRAYPIGVMKD